MRRGGSLILMVTTALMLPVLLNSGSYAADRVSFGKSVNVDLHETVKDVVIIV